VLDTHASELAHLELAQLCDVVVLVLFFGLVPMGGIGDACDFEKDEETVDELTGTWMRMGLGVGGVRGLEDPSYCFLAELL
jgi:hypothetical protein